jgi:hypothetical protein
MFHNNTLLGKRVQAKVSSKSGWSKKHKKHGRWQVNNDVNVYKGSSSMGAALYGSSDVTWAIFGVTDYFAVLPKSVLRRHRAFRGQGNLNKKTGEDVGRAMVYIYPGSDMDGMKDPQAKTTKAWQGLHKKYILRWGDADVKQKLKAIFAEA